MFARAAARQVAPAYRRTLATAAAAAERYPGGVQAMHWISGGSMLSCVGLVLVSGLLCVPWGYSNCGYSDICDICVRKEVGTHSKELGTVADALGLLSP